MLQLRKFSCIPAFGFKLRRPAAKPSEYDKERLAYKYIMKEYRKRNIKNYWELQSNYENEHIENYLEKEKIKQQKQEIWTRTAVVHRTYQDTQLHLRQLEKQRGREERVRKYFITEDIKKMNRQQILKILNDQSKYWFNDDNLDENLTTSVILPDTVIDETEYYLYLQEQQIYLENAQYDKLEDLMEESKGLEWKNRVGMDLYQRIIQLIKYLRQGTPLSKMEQEWDVCRSIVLRDESLSEQEQIQQVQKVDEAFNTLMENHINKFELNATHKLNFIRNQLIKLYNLMSLWEKYMHVVKINASLAKKIWEEERASLDLFSVKKKQRDNSGVSKNQKKRKDEGEGYLSADEKVTSDDEDLDVEKMIREKEKQSVGMEGDSDQTINPNDEEEVSIARMLRAADQEENSTLAEFEKKYAQKQFRNVVYTGQLQQNHLQDARNLYKGLDLDQIFTASLLEDDFEELHLDYESFTDIVKKEQKLKEFYDSMKEESIINDPDMLKLDTKVFIEVLKQNMSELEENQTIDRGNVNEVKKLLDYVGEKQIQEPQLLYKLWNYYR